MDDRGMTPSRELTAEELLRELDMVRDYPHLAVERAVKAEAERIRRESLR
jgi:hypothetical protein